MFAYNEKASYNNNGNNFNTSDVHFDNLYLFCDLEDQINFCERRMHETEITENSPCLYCWNDTFLLY